MNIWLLILVPLALQLVAAGSVTARTSHEALENEIRLLTLRVSDKDVDTLRRDRVVARVARNHSETMFRRGRLAHNVDGAGPAERVARQHRTLFGLAAENVGMRRGDLDDETLARELFEGWMDSPGHRANILADYQILEVGCAGDATAVYCTQLFIRQPNRLARAVEYRQHPQSLLTIELVTGDESVEHRIDLVPAGRDASGSGLTVVRGQAQLELPADPGTYQLKLWTEVEPNANRYRIVPGPLLCVASAVAAQGSACAAP